MGERLQSIVVVTVVAVWAALTIGSFVSPTHNVPTTVDTVMGIIAGGAVASEVVRRATKRNGNGRNTLPPDPPPRQPRPLPKPKPSASIPDEALKRGRKRSEE